MQLVQLVSIVVIGSIVFPADDGQHTPGDVCCETAGMIQLLLLRFRPNLLLLCGHWILRVGDRDISPCRDGHGLGRPYGCQLGGRVNIVKLWLILIRNYLL